MINHARTLLLNVDGSPSGFTSELGEEFIPPAFRAITLPGYLQQIRDILFGTSPDKFMLNYRARQYLGLLHATELQEFVGEFDNRITYDVLPEDDLFFVAFVTSIQKLEMTTSDLFLIDEVGPVDRGGRTKHTWRITVLTSSTVQVQRQTPPIQSPIQNYTLTEGLSSLIQLVGSGLQARFSVGIGSDWLVQARSRPTQDLGIILANLDTVSGSVADQLFAAGTPKGILEPFKTFRNLWKDHLELPYRLGALLLAWVSQANEIWKAQQ